VTFTPISFTFVPQFFKHYTRFCVSAVLCLSSARLEEGWSWHCIRKQPNLRPLIRRASGG
jgi:hypothetical protein